MTIIEFSNVHSDIFFFSRNDVKATSLKLTPDIWASVPLEEVEHLPFDIDGLKMYRLKYDPLDKFASTVDGRKWGGCFIKTKVFRGQKVFEIL